jgi:hypothetical protein
MSQPDRRRHHRRQAHPRRQLSRRIRRTPAHELGRIAIEAALAQAGVKGEKSAK